MESSKDYPIGENLKFAVLGDKGMFGSELVEYLSQVGLKVQGFNRANFAIDSLDTKEVSGIFREFDVVVNAIAYTAVDHAEHHFVEAAHVNGIIAGKLATASDLADVRFIHISTDYVFDGFGDKPYKVSDPLNPQSNYGRTKAFGEMLVSESSTNYSILRTAWLYGANGKCFPRSMATLLKSNGHVRVVSDQIGQPTWTKDLAAQVVQVAHLNEMPRIVHAVSSGQASWADFAREVAKSLGMETTVVEEISTADYPTPAKRPAWSVLDNQSEILELIGDWRERWRIAADIVLASK